MRLTYDDVEDFVHVQFSNDQIVKEVYQEPNVNLSYGPNGLVSITVFGAKRTGYWVANCNKLLLLIARCYDGKSAAI